MKDKFIIDITNEKLSIPLHCILAGKGRFFLIEGRKKAGANTGFYLGGGKEE